MSHPVLQVSSAADESLKSVALGNGSLYVFHLLDVFEANLKVIRVIFS